MAAWTDAVGPTGLASDKRRTEFNILSPSMAWPHVSGAAKLLKSEHPDWIPAVNLPAMMTAASPVVRAQELHEKLITFSTWNQPLFLHLAHVLPCTVCLSSPAEASNKESSLADSVSQVSPESRAIWFRQWRNSTTTEVTTQY